MREKIALLAATTLVGAAAPAPTTARVHVTGHSERLAARARRGDRVARASLVEEHMGLVRTIAFRYRDLGLPVEDLVQEGAIGLLGAIDDYDSGRGASFSTYAFWRVRAAVSHSLSAHGHLLRVPRPVLEGRRQIARARERLRAAGREPTLAELAAETRLARTEIAAALTSTRPVSLDQPRNDGTALGDALADDPATRPDAQLLRAEEGNAVRTALGRLRARKRTIVRRHFGLDGKPETLTEIAEDLHLSPERTRALKDEALRELAVDLGTAGGA